MLPVALDFRDEVDELHAFLQTLKPEDAWGFTPWDRARCAELIAGLRSDGVFTPGTLEGTIQYPGSKIVLLRETIFLVLHLAVSKDSGWLQRPPIVCD